MFMAMGTLQTLARGKRSSPFIAGSRAATPTVPPSVLRAIVFHREIKSCFVLAAAAIANRNSRRFSVISRSLQANYSEVAIAEVERNRFLQSDLNEAACGGGRYAW